MKALFLALVFISSQLLTSQMALADTSLHFTNHDKQNSLVQSSKGKVRVEQAGNTEMYMLFDQQSSTLTVVNNRGKSFQRITEARIQQAASKIMEAKTNLRANFDQLTPEQQAQLQPMIEKMALADAREQQIKPMGSNKVGGINCTEHQVLSNNKPSQLLCAADAKALNLSAQDYEAIADMLNMLADLSNKMGGGMMQAAISPREIAGIPILTQEHGSERHTSLRKIDSNSISQERFQVPATYTESQNP